MMKNCASILQKLSALRNEMFEIIIFPCNQFGEKEPRSQRDIAFFARKHGFRGVILSKGDVNGVDTRPTFRFLKANSDNIHIDGNFEGRFLMHSSGRTEALHPSVDVLELMERLQASAASAQMTEPSTVEL
mmetsp:Transcript_27613/g.46698  ORF Transcript_27613/g.46698 Transcript_27613/m.46698 type:complete len:131 (-) Transcript_27613:297-689(-)